MNYVAINKNFYINYKLIWKINYMNHLVTINKVKFLSNKVKYE